MEVHDRYELEVVWSIGAKIIGINNRNLTTFETSLEITYGLLEFIPDGNAVVTESGIRSSLDVSSMCSIGANAFLVGTF